MEELKEKIKKEINIIKEIGSLYLDDNLSFEKGTELRNIYKEHFRKYNFYRNLLEKLERGKNETTNKQKIQ